MLFHTVGRNHCGVCLRALALWTLLSGCGPNATTSTTQPPAGDPCAFPTPLRLEVGEGAVASLPVRTTPAADGLRVDQMPAGFSAVVEADVLKVTAPYGATTAPTLDVVATCAGREVRASVELVVRRIVWEEGPTWTAQNGPPGREYGAIWMDSGDPDTLLVHGGFHYTPAQFTPAWDSWALNLQTGTWRELSPATEPPHVMGGRVAPVKDQRAVLLHGGSSAESTIVPSLVRFDHAAAQPLWTDVTTDGEGPAGDYTGAFVYDPLGDRYIHACGANEELGYHCEVYTLTLDSGGVGHWQHVEFPSGPRPAGRNGFFFAMDTVNNRLVLFSGEKGSASWTPNLAQDTWALELAEPMAWVRLSVGEVPSIGRRNGAYLHDPVNNRMFVWGGTADGQTTFQGLWVLPLTRGHEVWQEVVVEGDAPTRSSGMGTYDAARNRFLVGFGNGTNALGRAAVFADLWSLRL